MLQGPAHHVPSRLPYFSNFDRFWTKNSPKTLIFIIEKIWRISIKNLPKIVNVIDCIDKIILVDFAHLTAPSERARVRAGVRARLFPEGTKVA